MAENSSEQNSGLLRSLENMMKNSEATQLASQIDSPCLVPKTDNEVYDCCGSDLVMTECKINGWLNVAILVSILIFVPFFVCKSHWFKN